MCWLASRGYTICLPFGHSPDFDLVAVRGDETLRVEVKTCGFVANGRYEVAIATRGGNQSWSGLTKYFDPARCDRVFVLVADGRRWFIPSAAIAARGKILLGGPKYAAYEVERGDPFPVRLAA